MARQQVDELEYRHIGENVEIGADSRVLGKRVSIGRGTSIGKAVSIEADEVRVGRYCVIEDGVKVSWRGGVPRIFELGDCCHIGQDSRILVAEFTTGDYVTLHNHLLATGDAKCSIGHNTWLGQNCILNSNAPLKIGNGVGIGTYSSVWTHGQYAEIIEGCLLRKEAPVVIEDDVWLVGCYNVVSPGVTIGRKAIALSGSVITKDMKPYSCWGGAPATDLSEKIRTYREVTIEEKFQMMKEFVSEFLEKVYTGEYKAVSETEYYVNSASGDRFRLLVKWEITDLELIEHTPALVITARNSISRMENENVTVFDVSDKTYTKRLTPQEIKLMKFLLDARARFVPR